MIGFYIHEFTRIGGLCGHFFKATPTRFRTILKLGKLTEIVQFRFQMGRTALVGTVRLAAPLLTDLKLVSGGKDIYSRLNVNHL
jgi:hypothetical protein